MFFLFYATNSIDSLNNSGKKIDMDFFKEEEKQYPFLDQYIEAIKIETQRKLNNIQNFDNSNSWSCKLGGSAFLPIVHENASNIFLLQYHLSIILFNRLIKFSITNNNFAEISPSFGAVLAETIIFGNGLGYYIVYLPEYIISNIYNLYSEKYLINLIFNNQNNNENIFNNGYFIGFLVNTTNIFTSLGITNKLPFIKLDIHSISANYFLWVNISNIAKIYFSAYRELINFLISKSIHKTLDIIMTSDILSIFYILKLNGIYRVLSNIFNKIKLILNLPINDGNIKLNYGILFNISIGIFNFIFVINYNLDIILYICFNISQDISMNIKHGLSKFNTLLSN